MVDIPVNSIGLKSRTHTDEDDQSTLSSNTVSKEIVLITPSDRKIYLYKSEARPVLQ